MNQPSGHDHDSGQHWADQPASGQQAASGQYQQPRFDPQTGQPLQPGSYPPPIPHQPQYLQPQQMAYAQGGYGPVAQLPYQQMMWFEANKKSMAVSYLLAIFLGSLGIHRFYLGRTGSALAMLLTTVCGWFTVCLYIGIFAILTTWVWTIVDLFLIPQMVNDENNKLLQQLQIAPPPGAAPGSHTNIRY